MDDCLICGGPTRVVFTARVRGSVDTALAQCTACEFVSLDEAAGLEHAREHGPVAADTGMVARTLGLLPSLASLLPLFARPEEPILDYGAGSGLLVRCLRDAGFRCWWHDPFAANIHARGFEAAFGTGTRFPVVVAIEVIEHLRSPLRTLDSLVAETGASTFVLSTQLFDGSTPPPPSWWYYDFESGQHVSFFNRRAMSELASRLGMRYVESRPLHVLTRESLSAARALLLAVPRARRMISPWLRRRHRPLTVEDHARHGTPRAAPPS